MFCLKVAVLQELSSLAMVKDVPQRCMGGTTGLKELDLQQLFKITVDLRARHGENQRLNIKYHWEKLALPALSPSSSANFQINTKYGESL